jgi:dolichyl-phosphate-mannose--protein O-mannosyl transferase
MPKLSTPAPKRRDFHSFSFCRLFASASPSRFEFTQLDLLFLSLTITASVLTHFLAFGFPAVVIPDEVGYVSCLYSFHRHSFLADLQTPSLGRQLLYLGSLMAGYHFGAGQFEAGTRVSVGELQRLRFLPCLFGSLRAPLMFAAFRLLGASSLWSLAFALCVATDQALIAQSRFVLLDSFVTAFAALTILAIAILARRISGRRALFKALASAGFAAGATVAVRFTSNAGIFTIVIALLMHYPFMTAVSSALFAGAIALFLHLGSCVGHFQMLSLDSACQSPNSRLCRMIATKEITVFRLAVELFQAVFLATYRMPIDGPFASRWWSLVIMAVPRTSLWEKGDQRIWAIGSPVVWWGGLVGLLAWIGVALFKKKEWGSAWLIAGWVISYLPCVFTQRLSRDRYFIPLLYSLAAAAVAATAIAPKARIAPLLLIGGAVLCYWLYFPITYGTPIQSEKLKARMLQCWMG